MEENLERIEEVLIRETQKASSIITDLIDFTINEYELGHLTNEESVYKILVHSIKYQFPSILASELDGAEKGGLVFSAREFSHSKKGSEERKTGADFAISLSVNIPDYQSSTAVYVQSKAETRNSGVGTGDLGDASLRMLEHTSDSFIFVFPLGGELAIIPAYSTAGIHVGDGTITQNFHETLPRMGPEDFMSKFAQGFVGDHRMVPSAIHPLAWEEREQAVRALQEYPVSRLLQIQVTHRDVEPTSNDMGNIYYPNY